MARINALRPAIVSTFLFCFHPFFHSNTVSPFLYLLYLLKTQTLKLTNIYTGIGERYSLSAVQSELGRLVYIVQVALAFVLFLKVAIT